jgi:hypothetical protein
VIKKKNAPKLGSETPHTHTFIITQFWGGYEFKIKLCSCFWFPASYKVAIKMLIRVAFIWRLQIRFQDGALTRLLLSVLNVLPWGPSYRTVWISSRLGSWLNPQNSGLREQNGRVSLFYKRALEATLHLICNILSYTRNLSL